MSSAIHDGVLVDALPADFFTDSPGARCTSYNIDLSDQVFRPARFFQIKYVVEQVIAALLLVPAIPVILVLGAITIATSRGPAIYRQKRVGLNGRVFDMFKIRTMVNDAEANSGARWCDVNDPRVTRFGRWLRLMHLDELPQLYNVVRGEMAIIGPRPERPEFVAKLTDKVAGYESRLVVKPGITGLAQIYLPPDIDDDCVRRKLCFDRAYIQTANWQVDLKIWACTIVRIVGIRQGRGPKWFRLDRRYHHIKLKCNAILPDPSLLRSDVVTDKSSSEEFDLPDSRTAWQDLPELVPLRAGGDFARSVKPK